MATTGASLTFATSIEKPVVALAPALSVAVTIGKDDLTIVPGILKSQAGIAAIGKDGKALDGTGLQIPGVLDDLYANDGPLGIQWRGGIPSLRVWAPTARNVNLLLFSGRRLPEGGRGSIDRDLARVSTHSLRPGTQLEVSSLIDR